MNIKEFNKYRDEYTLINSSYKLTKMIKHILFIIVITGAFMVPSCLNNNGSHINSVDTVFVSDTVIQIDTVIARDTIDVIKWKYKTVRIEVPVFVDTGTVITDYYTHKLRRDTSAIDSLGFIVINTNLYKNNIESMAVDWNLFKPEITITDKYYITKEIPVIKNGWSIGGGVGYDIDLKPRIHLTGMYTVCRFNFYGSLSISDARIGIMYKLK